MRKPVDDERNRFVESDNQDVAELEFIPGGKVPTGRQAGGQPGAKPAGREGIEKDCGDESRKVEHENRRDGPDGEAPEARGESVFADHGRAFPSTRPLSPQSGERVGVRGSADDWRWRISARA